MPRLAIIPRMVQGTLNVDGPAELALVTELQVPDDKLALFQTACFNPTIPGIG